MNELLENLDQNEVQIVINEDNKYSIGGYETFLRQIDTVLISMSVDELQNEERKTLTSLKKSVADYTSSLDGQLKKSQKELVGTIDTQRKNLVSKLNEITQLLKLSIDQSDQKARQTKQLMFEDELHRQSDYYTPFKEIDIFDIINSSWLNRTSSDKQSMKSLNERLNKVRKMIESDACRSTSPSEIVTYLSLHDWSEISAIDALNLKYKPADELAELEKTSSENEVSTNVDSNNPTHEEKVSVKEIVSLEIDEDDFDILLETLRLSGIEFRLV